MYKYLYFNYMNLAQKSTFLPLLKGASFPASRDADNSTASILSTGARRGLFPSFATACRPCSALAFLVQIRLEAPPNKTSTFSPWATFTKSSLRTWCCLACLCRLGALSAAPRSCAVPEALFPSNAARSNELEECEIVAKTAQNSWVVGRRSDQREFYVILSSKSANLIEIQGAKRRTSFGGGEKKKRGPCSSPPPLSCPTQPYR